MMLRKMAGPITAEQERQLGMVLHSGQQLLSLIDDVLDLARLDAGHLRIAVTTFSVAEAVSALVDMMVPIADGQHLGLSWSAADGAPEEITTDRGKFDQILLNLLSNALKFTDEGSVSCTVRAAPAGAVAIDVIDTGIGIPAEELDRIFEHFHQVRPSTVAPHPGTGLGLAISRRLAEAIGGTITVVSVVGEGSTFTLTVPAEPPADGPSAELSAEGSDDGPERDSTL